MLLMQATLIFASTPATRESPCKSILEGKYRGKYICLYFNFEFTCPGCKLIQESMSSYICPHRIHWRPMHQNPEILYIARAAYGEGSEDFKREIMGTDATMMHRFIHQKTIDNLRIRAMDSSRVVIRQAPKYVFVSCDPCGSTKKSEEGTTSDYAFVTACFVGGTPVVSLSSLCICNVVFNKTIWFITRDSKTPWSIAKELKNRKQKSGYFKSRVLVTLSSCPLRAGGGAMRSLTSCPISSASSIPQES